MSEVNPIMITLARESRQVTQSVLAKSLKIAQGTLSKVENGQIPASDDLLKDLAVTLEYPKEIFFESETFRHLPISFYRKRISVNAKILCAITARMNILRMQIRKLLRSADIPELGFATVDLKEIRGNVEAIAQELRIRWHLPPGPVANVTTTLENAGVIIIRFNFGTTKVDGLSVYDPRDSLPPLILINDGLSGDRARFTLCHEFAHILFHHHLPAFADDADMEKQANAFASAFLMPTKDIKPFLHHPTLKKLASLKPHWKVSIQSLLMKASSLNMISERQARYMWMQMGKLGYRHNEPYLIKPEEPSLFQELVRFHIEELKYSEEQLLDTLRMNGTDFRRQYFGEKGPPPLRMIK
jgi:Zn-dependent peptidase ImmA (M78 family)/transcriptional regulator with XRE-family HTH domain